MLSNTAAPQLVSTGSSFAVACSDSEAPGAIFGRLSQDFHKLLSAQLEAAPASRELPPD